MSSLDALTFLIEKLEEEKQLAIETPYYPDDDSMNDGYLKGLEFAINLIKG